MFHVLIQFNLPSFFLLFLGESCVYFFITVFGFVEIATTDVQVVGFILVMEFLFSTLRVCACVYT